MKQVRRQTILEDIKNKIKLYGFTAKELGFSGVEKSTEKKTEDKRRQPVPVKYRDGEEKWTGRGRKPKWLVEKLATGAKLEDFAV